MPTKPNKSHRVMANDKRWGDAVPVPEPLVDISSIVIIVAGLAGGAIFLATLQVMFWLMAQSVSFQVAIPAGVGATLSILLAADWFIEEQRSAWMSAVIGMLLAAPFALVLAVGLGMQTYYMGAKNIPGAAVMGVLTYVSFFLTLSLGGWVAIRWRRSIADSEARIMK